MKKLLTAALGVAIACSCVCGFAACGKDPDTLVVGITIYEPMDYYENGVSGKIVGFDAEFAEKALGELGKKTKFQIIDWDNKINELKTKNIDLIWNGMTITDELQESIAISDPYMENKQVVVAKKENAAKFTDTESVKGAASIAAESGSAGESAAEDLGYEGKLNKVGAQSDALLEVKTGASEIAILDITMARTMTGEGTDYSDLTFIDVGFAGEEYGIGLRKEDTELLEQLNAIIAKYKTDGTFDALVAKYMV